MKRVHGYCAVLALKYVSGMPENQVLDVCRWHEFRDNGKGMDDESWPAAADDLGIKRRKLPKKYKTVGDFLKTHPHGLYLVTTYNHIFAVLNGGIVSHPLQDQMDRRCKFEAAWKILR